MQVRKLERLRSPTVPMSADRRLLARTYLALAVANARYWPSVWPVVQRQLRRWERRAAAIQQPELRTLALAKLHGERFNAEVAATLATIAPAAQRASAIEAIVALEVLYDYLDGLTEQPSTEPLEEGDALFGAFRDAVDLAASPGGGDYFRHRAGHDDGGYLLDLSTATHAVLAGLPAMGAVADVAVRATARCAQAQVRKHAVPSIGTEQLESWARGEAAGTSLGWRELTAGAASSVLTVHALIAAAADPRTTPGDAAGLEQTYLLIGVLITALDSLIDYSGDVSAGEPGFVGLYHNQEELTLALTDTCRRAAAQASTVTNAPHHLMTLAGVVAYYTSAPGARSQIARPVAEHLQAQLRPLITPTLTVMRTWRLAKQTRERRRRTGPRGGPKD
jgi:tetraprenyl-beta-curcumene synthase